MAQERTTITVFIGKPSFQAAERLMLHSNSTRLKEPSAEPYLVQEFLSLELDCRLVRVP